MNSRNNQPAIINAAAFVKDSLVLGPSKRDGLWVQGCRILCPGCGNQAYLAHEPRRLIPVSRLLRHFQNRRGVIDGLSILGGEPTEQAGPVADLLEGVQHLGFSTVVFTGHLYETLKARQDPDINRLLSATDLLIDGPFIAREMDPSLQWRGSKNQRLLYLSDRFDSYEKMESKAVATEIILDSQSISLNGVKHVKIHSLL